MIKFEKTPEKDCTVDGTTVVMTMNNDETLTYILKEFEGFLKAVGFHFDSDLKLMKSDEEV